MSMDSTPEFTPNFSSFSWDDKPASVTVGTPKSPAPSSRSQKTPKTSRRRIVRACMRCRLRKTKCDGGKPCTRCTEADDVCEYMKCSKKESKEYPQDYVERLLEQNDKYKTAMRILYANRRLSIQPDNIVIPNMESDDIPLVHDILNRLGMVTQEPDQASQSSGSHFEKPTLTKAPTFSSPSVTSIPSPTNSIFNHTYFDDPFLPSKTPIDTTFFPDTNPQSFDADMGLDVPFEVYSSMNESKNDADYMQFSSDFPQSQDVSTPDWCPMSVLDSVMGGEFSADQAWNENGTFQQPSY